MAKRLITLSLIISALICMCIIPCSAAYVQDNEGNYYILGDVNGDETVDVRDLVRLKKYIANKETEVSPASVISSDANALDLSFLRKLIINDGDEFLQNDGNWSQEII